MLKVLRSPATLLPPKPLLGPVLGSVVTVCRTICDVPPGERRMADTRSVCNIAAQTAPDPTRRSPGLNR
ncbi:hypothetical protein M407DRAFT_247024 [Tulasnella calospora MUT 4182]|uniref:Uncharacterized protein n=1 Tax=Tulasnella calospora MUT 4182 TaxID=1051891 RepID=A0A0C3Q181_9AGAM|nr:hypothetical protein M407DRAFT_247024 [Tulasnella calospora MUT 4182]